MRDVLKEDFVGGALGGGGQLLFKEGFRTGICFECGGV
jgi:hypothetical protein